MTKGHDPDRIVIETGRWEISVATSMEVTTRQLAMEAAWTGGQKSLGDWLHAGLGEYLAGLGEYRVKWGRYQSVVLLPEKPKSSGPQ